MFMNAEQFRSIVDNMDRKQSLEVIITNYTFATIVSEYYIGRD